MTMKSTVRSLILATVVAAVSIGARAQSQVTTFTKDVAPILQEKCQVCHRSGTSAPMSLLTYQDARPWAKSIKAKVAAREMPPWFIDKNLGIQHFDNDESLTDQQIATLVKWVDDGALEGDPAAMPPPRKFPDEQAWQIGEPDLILKLPTDVQVKPHGPDWWPDIDVDPHLTEDRYIKSIQVIPTKGYTVIHHIRTSIVQPGEDNSKVSGGTDGNLEVGEVGVWLSEYAIGKGPDLFRDGSGRLIKAGDTINFQFHLHPNGTLTPVNVVMGIKFYPKGYVPQHIVNTISVGSNTVDLRPHEADVRDDGYLPLAKAARILSFQPHLHVRGKAECVEAIYPNGKREMLNCTRFQFNWMRNYTYAEDSAPLLPAGTILHTIMWHDNSDENKANPDPDAQITWGSRTVDEMGHGYFNMYYMSDEDYKKEVEARKAQQKTLTSVLTDTNTH